MSLTVDMEKGAIRGKSPGQGGNPAEKIHIYFSKPYIKMAVKGTNCGL